jgi:hypothetical protein
MMRRADPPPRGGTPVATPRVQTARIDPGGERGRGPWSLMLGALVLVALAIAKPWGNGAPGPGAGGGGAGSSPATSSVPQALPPTRPPTPPSADELAVARCNQPLGWRTYALETWRGQTIRHFIVVDPLAATTVSDALDPRIPIVPLIGEAITAIGYCAPAIEAGRPPPGVTIMIWKVELSGIVHALPAVRIEPAVPSSLMALFAYPDPAAERDRRAPWPPGRYLFGVLGPPDSDWGRWFAVEVVEFRAGSAP